MVEKYNKLKKIEILVAKEKGDLNQIIHHFMDGSTATHNNSELGVVDDVSGTLYQHKAKLDDNVPVKKGMWIIEKFGEITH